MAVQMLARRVLSQAELRKKLLAKKLPAEEVADAVERCLSHGFINDAFLSDALADEMHARGCGSRKIASKLSMRGLDRELVHESLNSVAERPGAVDESEAAITALRRKAKNLAHEPDLRKRRLKALRFLAGRGFSAENANKAIASCHTLFE